MSFRILSVSAGTIFACIVAPGLRADELDMQNGDRYFGTVLSVSADTVVLKSDMLGVINVPRTKVTNLAFGVKAAVPVSASPKPPVPAPPAASAGTNADLSTALRGLGADTNFIGQVRQKFLADNPGAASNYDAMVGGLLDGSLNLDDLRRQARSAADQLRELKRTGSSDSGIPVDAYLEVLDRFVNETASEPTNPAPALPPKSTAP
jgi:hypothetical protein